MFQLPLSDIPLHHNISTSAMLLHYAMLAMLCYAARNTTVMSQIMIRIIFLCGPDDHNPIPHPLTSASRYCFSAASLCSVFRYLDNEISRYLLPEPGGCCCHLKSELGLLYECLSKLKFPHLSFIFLKLNSD